MNLIKLKKIPQKQWVKFRFSHLKTKKNRKIVSAKTLQASRKFYPEWVTIFPSNEQEIHSPNYLLQHKIHPSVYSKTKRLVDLCGSVIGLLFTAAIFVPVAIAIKIDSPGSIFYSQVRCGLLGKPFLIWKFRTMFAGSERQQHLIKNEIEGCVFKNRNDPRVTRIGKFLRRTSLDESPQFWNVFKGEMSLVGTRPPTPNEISNYQSHHYRRLLVKPGITGEWQVRGRSSIKNFDEIVRLDLEYQRKWSLLYDIKLILQTIAVVLLSKGAY